MVTSPVELTSSFLFRLTMKLYFALSVREVVLTIRLIMGPGRIPLKMMSLIFRPPRRVRMWLRHLRCPMDALLTMTRVPALGRGVELRPLKEFVLKKTRVGTKNRNGRHTFPSHKMVALDAKDVSRTLRIGKLLPG